MLNKNTPGEKKSEAKSEAPVSSYSYMRLKKCDIWLRPRPKLFASNRQCKINYIKISEGSSFTLDVQQFEHN